MLYIYQQLAIRPKKSEAKKYALVGVNLANLDGFWQKLEVVLEGLAESSKSRLSGG